MPDATSSSSSRRGSSSERRRATADGGSAACSSTSDRSCWTRRRTTSSKACSASPSILDHARNRRLYVAYSRRGGPSTRGDLVVAEYRRTSARAADPSSGRIVLVVDKGAPSHNGGSLVFGPDGFLYIGIGDGEFPGDPNEVAQDRRSLLGKILRIDPLDPDGSGPRRYRIPNGNPFVGRAGLDEIWSLGLRNPWGFSFDPPHGRPLDRRPRRSQARGGGPRASR